MTPHALISRTFKQKVSDVLHLCMIRVKHVMNLTETSMPCDPFINRLFDGSITDKYTLIQLFEGPTPAHH